MKLKIDTGRKLKNLLDGEEFSLENLAIGDIEQQMEPQHL